jgi:hypothetical protein
MSWLTLRQHNLYELVIENILFLFFKISKKNIFPLIFAMLIQGCFANMPSVVIFFFQ